MKRKFKNILRDTVLTHNPFYKEREGARVLCFHDIQDKISFRERMQWLQAHFEIVSLDEIEKNNKNTVAISFDDGYRSWYTKVFPILDELQIPACFFVNSGLLDLDEIEGQKFLKNKVRREEENLFAISKQQLKEMSEHPLFTIGGHTKDHIDFSVDHSLEEIEKQIKTDKSNIESCISKTIEYFAYPFGQLSNAPSIVQDLVQDAGYLAAFTIIPGFRNSAKYLQNRDSLELWQSEKLWDRWLHGAYDDIVKTKLKQQGQM